MHEVAMARPMLCREERLTRAEIYKKNTHIWLQDLKRLAVEPVLIDHL